MEDVGAQLRKARVERGMSLRELARRLELSASALSQIETGKNRPNVETLYMIVAELGLSLDDLVFRRKRGAADDSDEAGPGSASAGERHGPRSRATDGPLQHGEDRPSIQLDSGVTWERLTAEHDPEGDFFTSVYEPGGASSRDSHLIVHSGREYHLLLKGRLTVSIGFETYELKAGDSISFASTEPHRLFNPGDTPAETVTFVMGRRQDDRRNLAFNEGSQDD
jgi:transcriptional regulator with XRE-family HTH domain